MKLEAEEISNPSSFSHLDKFRRYVEGQANVSGVVLQSLNVGLLEEFANLKRLNSAKQSDISSFFLKL